MDYDKICEHCGQKYDTLAEMQAHTSGPECLRRQLAAAKERAGRLEVQMVELRRARSIMKGENHMVYGGHGNMWPAHEEAEAVMDRILGGS